MKRRPSDRKVNYGSIVKGNMRMSLAGLAPTAANLPHNIQMNTRIGGRKCLTMHHC
jgi:hypothetical protein